jgi:hypothetical protein
LETQAKRHYRAAERNLARFAADLRRLQDGEAHLTRGFSSFGAYAEHTFHGLSAANAKKISIQGAVLLALEQHGRISLEEQASQLPGATGCARSRRSCPSMGTRRCSRSTTRPPRLRPGRAVVDSTVNLAVHGLLAPPPTFDAPAAAEDHGPPPSAADKKPVDVEDQAPDVDEDDDPLEDPEAVHELHDRLIEIRSALDDLGAVTTELAATRGRQEAQRILTDLLEEIHELPHALAAAIASQHPDT